MQVGIVGGGIAGAITALQLQRRGVGDIRIFERRKSAGTTLCGEGVSAATLQALTPAFDAKPHIDSTFRGARWQFPGPTVQINATCHTMARENWIPAMLDQVEQNGGTIEYGHRWDGQELATDVLVGADGPGSRVRQLIPGAEVLMKTGIQYRMQTDASSQWLEFETGKKYSREYAWWFPRREMHNVGLISEGDRDDWRRLDQFIIDRGIEGKVVKKEAFPIAFGGTKFARRDGRVVLIGDAAGLTNPLTKGGMAAIVHASGVLADCIADGRPRDYQRAMARHPMTSTIFPRALRRLRSWDDAKMARLSAAAGSVVEVGGPRPSHQKAARAIIRRRPWLAPAAVQLWSAGRGCLQYSW